MSIEDNFVPVYKYVAKRDIHKQDVYRKIREGKIPADKIKVVEKTVKRILIDNTFEIELRKKSSPVTP